MPYCNARMSSSAIRVIKFSDVCSVQRGTSEQAGWCFCYLYGKYDPEMITEILIGKRIGQIV
jgi:hypothetical protein